MWVDAMILGRVEIGEVCGEGLWKEREKGEAKVVFGSGKKREAALHGKKRQQRTHRKQPLLYLPNDCMMTKHD